MKHYKHLIIAILVTILLGVPWLINTYPQSMTFIDKVFYYAENNFATVFLRESITVTELHEKYNEVPQGKSKVRILIMPGHEPNYGGAEYDDLKERDMNVELAGYLNGFFKNNSHYETVVAREGNSWNPDLQNYFDSHWDDIANFFKDNKNEMIRLVNKGTVSKITNGVVHNSAPQNIALRLYGINKWSNENKIDIAIHIHFNDYPRRDSSVPGKYSGLAIYVPERQYSNSTTTRAIADAVFKRLTKYNAISNLPKEDKGVVEEQDLIAIGSYNTSDAPSMLIEYGYIYEPQFTDQKVRESTLKDLAFQTYLGIQDFFGSGNDVSLAYDTLMLPHTWQEDLNKDTKDKGDVLALQTALLLEGVYPGVGKTKNDCPRTGKFGPCTAEAVNNFQKKYKITNEKELVGEQTKKILNNLYSAQFR